MSWPTQVCCSSRHYNVVNWRDKNYLLSYLLTSFTVYGTLQVLQCRRRAAELRTTVVRPLRSSSGGATVAGRVTDNRHQNTAETNYKAFVTTILLTGTLVVFWLPYMIFQLLSAHVNPEQSVTVTDGSPSSAPEYLSGP